MVKRNGFSAGMVVKLGFSIALALALPSCSQEEEQESFEAEQEEAIADQQKANRRTPSKQERQVSAPELAIIPVAVREKSPETSLSLTAAATLYTITLSDCDSLYTSSANETSTNLQVYKFDTGCLAKLTTFTFNGFTYTPSAGDAFTTWDVGDEAIFQAGADATNTLRVIVISTLDSPVSGVETIEYEFSEITEGADEEIADTVVGDAHAMTVSGQASPAFTIAAVEFDGLTAGVGAFTFTLDCVEDLDVDLCVDVDLTNIRYVLVEDPDGTALTYAEAQALFPVGENSINMATEKLAVGAGGTVHGGFVTKSLAGPGPIHSKPNMLLVIEAADLSYLYFNVDVEVLTQD